MSESRLSDELLRFEEALSVEDVVEFRTLLLDPDAAPKKWSIVVFPLRGAFFFLAGSF